MDLDGSLSTEVAIIKNKQDYNDIVTMGLALSNDGKPVPSQARKPLRPDPEGGKKRRGGQGLPQIFDPAEGLQRVSEDRARPQSAGDAVDREERPVVARPQDPHRAAYVQQGLLGPTVPTFWVSNPAYAQVQNEHVWQTAWAEIMQDGVTPQAAAEKAFKRVEEIFAKYPIAQT